MMSRRRRSALLKSVDGITFDRSDATLRISWDNRECKTDKFMFWAMLFVLIPWTAVAIHFTWRMFNGEYAWFVLLFVLFQWSIAGLAVTRLIQLNYEEWIEVNKDGIAWGGSGWLAPKSRHVAAKDVLEITYGRAPNMRPRREAVVTINVWEKLDRAFFNRRRHLLAYWLDQDSKQLIYARISNHIFAHRIKIETWEYL